MSRDPSAELARFLQFPDEYVPMVYMTGDGAAAARHFRHLRREEMKAGR